MSCCVLPVCASAGGSELVRAVTQCGHLVGDTIVQGSATSHMVPVEQAEGGLHILDLRSGRCVVCRRLGPSLFEAAAHTLPPHVWPVSTDRP